MSTHNIFKGSFFKIKKELIFPTQPSLETQERLSTIKNEAYAIYVSFKKMVFYLGHAEVLIRSNHAPS